MGILKHIRLTMMTNLYSKSRKMLAISSEWDFWIWLQKHLLPHYEFYELLSHKHKNSMLFKIRMYTHFLSFNLVILFYSIIISSLNISICCKIIINQTLIRFRESISVCCLGPFTFDVTNNIISCLCIGVVKK